jgi:hypothetical protein
LRQRWTALALVALLAAGALYFFALRPPRPAPPTREGPFILPIYPVGIVDRVPDEFRWREVPGARSYVVEVLDASQRVVWKGKTRDCRLALPKEIGGRLRAREILFYRIRAKAFFGKEVKVSEPVFLRLGVVEP